MDIKTVVVTVFKALSTDTELLSLMEVPSSAMEDIKKQIIEEAFPSDFVETQLSRLSVFERPSGMSDFITESGYFEIDIFVHKDINALDRRILLIAQRIKSLFKTIPIGLEKPKFVTRIPNLPCDHPDWLRYALVFKYDQINL